jgi:hypothetical protein
VAEAESAVAEFVGQEAVDLVKDAARRFSGNDDMLAVGSNANRFRTTSASEFNVVVRWSQSVRVMANVSISRDSKTGASRWIDDGF